MADEALLDLLSEPTQYRDDLYRNSKTCRDGQHLFDDLTDNASDFDIANKFEALTRIPAAAPTIERPFDDTIEYPFNNLAVTRFSDGSFGVFYGSLELETTISETIYHWLGFLNDSDFLTREIIGDRRVYLVRADATLFDCTEKYDDYPDLVHPHDYTFTNQVGAYIRESDRDGLITRSARCDGTNAPVFRQDRLSDSRVHCHLTYRVFPADHLVIVERQLGTTFMEISWEDVGFDQWEQ